MSVMLDDIRVGDKILLFLSQISIFPIFLVMNPNMMFIFDYSKFFACSMTSQIPGAGQKGLKWGNNPNFPHQKSLGGKLNHFFLKITWHPA